MQSTLIAVDTAKLVFEVAEADAAGKVRRRLRLNRQQFSEYLATWQHGTVFDPNQSASPRLAGGIHIRLLGDCFE